MIRKLDDTCRQIWYADDSAAWGSLDQLRSWWSQLSRIGPGFGYFANPSNTWLVVKESKLEDATATFAGSGVNITCSVRPYLGAAIGSDLFVKEYVEAKVTSWVALTRQLSEIAKSQPQAAFSAFTHGLQSKWTFVSRVIPNISHLLEPLDTAIRCELIPALTGHPPPSDLECALLALPARLGGLGLRLSSMNANIEHRHSLLVTSKLNEHILNVRDLQLRHHL